MAWLKSAAIPLRPSEEHDETQVGLIHGDRSTTGRLRQAQDRSTRGLSLTGILLITSNIFWALLCGATWQSSSKCHTEQRMSRKADFVSEPVLSLKPKTVDFDDLLLYNASSKAIYRQMDHTKPVYFGKPSPEIDAAWKTLLWPEYPAISPHELKLNKHLTFEEKDRLPATGQFHVALDVFHDLHCLNAVRKELDKEYYGGHHHHGSIGSKDSSPVMAAAQRDHIDHCLNHVRQALQCRTDLSPAAMHIYPDQDGSLFWVGNAKTHSCYDWNDLMDWVNARRTGAFGFWEEHDD